MAAVVMALKHRLGAQEFSGSKPQIFELTENQLHAQEQADAPSVKRRPMPAKHERWAIFPRANAVRPWPATGMELICVCVPARPPCSAECSTACSSRGRTASKQFGSLALSS